MVITAKVRYPENGYTDFISVVVEPGETVVDAIIQRGDAQFEWELIDVTLDENN